MFSETYQTQMFVSLLPASSSAALGVVAVVGVATKVTLSSPEPLASAVLLRAEFVLARGRVWLPLPPLLLDVRGMLFKLLLLALLLLLLGVWRGRVPF